MRRYFAAFRLIVFRCFSYAFADCRCRAIDFDSMSPLDTLKNAFGIIRLC